MSATARSLRLLLVAALLACLGLVGCSSPEAGPVGASGLPTVALPSLPREARDTYALVQRGGPYPYPQDGRTFGNREQLLPEHPYGWYREYTVETPGSPDRGARRLVAGEDGTTFYTDDHYQSFREVLP